MHHLSPDTFVDLLDGTLAEEAVPHLASCAACRQQLQELRATWQAASEADVPEPSPLFWEHLSARVHGAIAQDAQPSARWCQVEWSWRSLGVTGAAVAALALVAFLQLPRPVALRPTPTGAPANSGASATLAELEPLAPLPDDESIGFVADLAGDLDWDGVAELGLTAEGLADRGAAEMTAGERVELRRLLREELGPSAAADL